MVSQSIHWLMIRGLGAGRLHGTRSKHQHRPN